MYEGNVAYFRISFHTWRINQTLQEEDLDHVKIISQYFLANVYIILIFNEQFRLPFRLGTNIH